MNNLSNLAKLFGGYIYVPMITEEVVNLTNEQNVFNEANQQFLDLKQLKINDSEIDSLLQSVKYRTDHYDIITRMQEYSKTGKYKDHYIDLFKKQEFVKIAKELDYINMPIVDPELVFTLGQYKKTEDPQQRLGIYIEVLKHDTGEDSDDDEKKETKYNKLLRTAREEIQTKIVTKTRELLVFKKRLEDNEKIKECENKRGIEYSVYKKKKEDAEKKILDIEI